MSLHEDLKKRFLEIAVLRHVSEVKASTQKDVPWEPRPWLDVMADECIRQMRWAECSHTSPNGGPPPYLCTEAAPDGWKPPYYQVYSFKTGEEVDP